ncbi:hypothetical protein UF75_2000 [Desulfosporosinus sp. I2]|nr:hypothetical protein UF75_2000 [Desulfosporosinus sp. I2]
MSTAIGDCGFIGRWGGEEFLIVLETAQWDLIFEKANEIRRAVAEYWHADIGKSVTMTLGFCQYRENTSLDILIASADERSCKSMKELSKYIVIPAGKDSGIL